MSTRCSFLSRLVLAGAGAVLLGVLPAGPAAAAGPSGPSGTEVSHAVRGTTAPRHSGRSVPAQGGLTVTLDPATLRAEPVAAGTGCRLRVAVTLQLDGTVSGVATGATTATVSAPCAAVLSAPPGAFADTFRFTGTFRGTVAAAPVRTTVDYAGFTRAGGDVSAVLTMRGDATVLAGVRARAGAAGTYAGVAIH